MSLVNNCRVQRLDLNEKSFSFADYVSGGELFTHVFLRDHFTEDEVRIYIGEVILALEHLHKVNPVTFSILFILPR